ncbi:hypothetical protein [Oceanibacterium hippocampi]|uniref:Molybdopterin-guanine dinucleotide biosynthesis protein A n=1 Tax=Oceanibacterium hippocampi TaxID=745714 RepID=A0A1Y5TZ59_9PROT|nr:hypothetical protein [Oceanibacterium hippocampi]SLN77173.1 hypothetical protein OCH7691_04316 [Oceanibacterium hippocampi]
MKVIAVACIVVAALGIGASEVRAADDEHAGYYYPGPATAERYEARAQVMPDASRTIRLGFVTGMTQAQFSRPYPPDYAIFAKGAEAEKLIIVALSDSSYATIYQMRGLLAQLTAVARTTDLFREYEVEDLFTFFDLAKLLGFTQITVSNGLTYSHQVSLD